MFKIAVLGFSMALGVVLLAGGNDLGFLFFAPILIDIFFEEYKKS